MIPTASSNETRLSLLAHKLFAPVPVLALVLVLRFGHMLAALESPLTFQIGPDEDFYRRFGMDVAFGSGGMTSEFGFMDPLYGYLLGAIFKLGAGAFPAYFLQVAIDAGTAYALILIGRELGRPGLGLGAALIYALVGPAMAFTMMLLKTTCVTAYVTWWIVFALRALRSDRQVTWLLFGLFCGLGVALRANLILLLPLALLVLIALRRSPAQNRPLLRQVAALLLGALIPLLALAVRNHTLAGRWSPVPTNGGVVLHQLYNPENPRSLSGAPSFVRYGHPSEIRRGYVVEAERRLKCDLSDAEVESYWRGEAKSYLLAHPWQSMRNALRKLGEFSAYPEVPNNRSYADEREFSVLLRVLPQPFGWLFVLGLPGLVLLVIQDRRGLVLWVPVTMGLVTIAVFFAEDRFRFNIVTPFVFGTAAWVAWGFSCLRRGKYVALGAATLLSLFLGAVSLWQSTRISPTPRDWQRIANGYVRMGEPSLAVREARDALRRDPRIVGAHEIMGLVALQEEAYSTARAALEAALVQRQDRHEVWHNYSVLLEHFNDLEGALYAAAKAEALSPLPEYQFRMAMLLEQLDRPEDATDLYVQLTRKSPQRGDRQDWGVRATERLRRINAR